MQSAESNFLAKFSPLLYQMKVFLWDHSQLVFELTMYFGDLELQTMKNSKPDFRRLGTLTIFS